MNKMDEFMCDAEVQWCPGCPNFGILNAFKRALTDLRLKPQDICLVSGIGQAAKFPHYLKCNFFNGLHGRAIPAALGIHTANPRLTTIVTTGEGDCYGEGGNHFIHVLRRNPNITIVVHNNEFYALTKGQASPTTRLGEKRSLQTQGVEISPINMPAIAMVHDCTFVARGFAGDMDHLEAILVKAIKHPGLSYVEVLQPCITWGHHPLSWHKARVDKLEDDYDPGNRDAALKKVMETSERIPIGILYQGTPRATYADRFRTEITDKPFAELKPLAQEKMTAFLSRYKVD
ncbi:MAG: 2-oxoacid ferredoxin oxidoreductase [Deltaproteobacteria bacterium]|nr:2-oxoacid ferredoxin oxidoreductase [Deltaproteobacteria bacterium]